MICRSCREEYEADQVEQCPYCGATNPLAALRSSSADEIVELGPLVLVAEARGDRDLERWSEALGAEGIPIFVQQRNVAESLGLLALLRRDEERTECREILVPAALAERAGEVLAGLDEEEEA